MEPINYRQIYTKFTKGLSPKIKDIFDRRFGVKVATGAKAEKDQTLAIETLESIGKGLGITRERVRQIEEAGFSYVRKNHKEALEAIFKDMVTYFTNNGGFKNEAAVLEDLGGKKNKPYVLFLLTLGKNYFTRISQKKDHHYFWALKDDANKVKETLNALVGNIKEHGKLLTKEELFSQIAPKQNLSQASLASYLGVSKKIKENKEGKFGLIDWPEIKPRGVKDKAFLVFQKEKKPLHFRQITQLIDTLEYGNREKKTHPQTVHNELIKDQRFVLVGRGTYALKEWGYTPGTIKDVITKVLQEKQQPIGQEDLVKEVLNQRMVAKNTVLINLNNKKHFTKDTEGKYFLRQTESA